MLPQVTVTRYVTPLKEGGSLPGIVEASDDAIELMKASLKRNDFKEGVASFLQKRPPNFAPLG